MRAEHDARSPNSKHVAAPQLSVVRQKSITWRALRERSESVDRLDRLDHLVNHGTNTLPYVRHRSDKKVWGEITKFTAVLLLLALVLLFGMMTTSSLGIHILSLGGMLSKRVRFEVAHSPVITHAESVERKEVHDAMLLEQSRRAKDGIPVELSCRSTASMHLLGKLYPGAKLDIDCPPGCKAIHVGDAGAMPERHMVWGESVYLDASQVCLAAIHNLGIDGGNFVVWLTDGLKQYPGTLQHGVQSMPYNGGHTRAFTLSVRRTWDESQAQKARQREKEAAEAEISARGRAPADKQDIRKTLLEILSPDPTLVEGGDTFQSSLLKHELSSTASNQPKVAGALGSHTSKGHTFLLSMWEILASSKDTQDSVDTLASAMDTNVDGRVSEDEFVEYWKRLSTSGHDGTPTPPLIIQNLFRSLDTNNNGNLSLKELTQAYSKFNEEVNTQSNQMLQHFDADHDKSMSVDELKKLRSDISVHTQAPRARIQYLVSSANTSLEFYRNLADLSQKRQAQTQKPSKSRRGK